MASARHGTPSNGLWAKARWVNVAVMEITPRRSITHNLPLFKHCNIHGSLFQQTFIFFMKNLDILSSLGQCSSTAPVNESLETICIFSDDIYLMRNALRSRISLNELQHFILYFSVLGAPSSLTHPRSWLEYCCTDIH